MTNSESEIKMFEAYKPIDGANERGVYLAGPSGFSDSGLLWHNTVLMPKVVAAGLIAVDPWDDQSAIAEIMGRLPWGEERRNELVVANLIKGRQDLAMVDSAAGMLACLDGQDVDSGTALEIGYAHKGGKLIVGLRTDIRISSDNEGSQVNLMIETCALDSGGIITSSVDEAVEFLASKLVN